MNFQIASDLHLEFRGGASASASAMPRPKAPMLILAGDVCPEVEPDFAEALARVADPFEVVLYVPGNHEYYGSDDAPQRVDERIERTCFSRMRNVIYLNKRRVDIGGFAYIGATMWTDCPNDSSLLSDFSHIDGGRFTPARMNALHREHRDWLRSAVRQAKRDGCTGAVVVTHHVPDKKLAQYALPDSTAGAGNRSSGPLMPFYFASDMGDVASDSFVQVWCHGHTHESYRAQLEPRGTIYATNGLGYPNEHTGYSNGGAVLRLQSKK
jgi:predicted phosphodiesterase